MAVRGDLLLFSLCFDGFCRKHIYLRGYAPQAARVNGYKNAEILGKWLKF